MMLALGFFAFSLKTAPYQQLRRVSSARAPRNAPVGQRPTGQFVGPGDDKITLSGILYPELTGGPGTLKTLREMMLTGKAYVLIDGDGNIMGNWSIETVSETKSNFLQDGTARKITFELSIIREPDEASVLGDLKIEDAKRS